MHIWQNSALVAWQYWENKDFSYKTMQYIEHLPKTLFAEVCQECVAGWVEKEPFVSNLHLQRSQLKYCDLDPSYSVSNLSSEMPSHYSFFTSEMPQRTHNLSTKLSLSLVIFQTCLCFFSLLYFIITAAKIPPKAVARGWFDVESDQSSTAARNSESQFHFKI